MKRNALKRWIVPLACAVVALAFVAAGWGMALSSGTTANQEAVSPVVERRVADVDVGAAPDAVDGDVGVGQDGTPSSQTEGGDGTGAIGGQEVVSEAEPFTMPDGAQYVPQTALVRFAKGTTAEEANALLEASGLAGAADLTQEEVDSGLVSVALADGVSVEDAVNELAASPLVGSSQPDYVYTLAAEYDAESDAEAVTAGESQVGMEVPVIVEETEEAEEPSVSADDTGTEAADGLSEGEPDVEVFAQQDEDAEVANNGEATDDVGADDGVLVASGTTNDPQLGSQWGLSSVDAYDAWDVAKTSGAVTVAVLDVGCYVNHEDLSANILTSGGSKVTYNSYNALNGGSVTDVTDTTSKSAGHGTHVAGIIAAVANNGVGVAGVSYNARILPVKVCDSTGNATTSSLVKAYSYLMVNRSAYNIRVANISMAASISAEDAALDAAIDEAYQAGIVTVAASGNNASGGAYDAYPGDYATVVSVIALQQSGSGVTKWRNSNYNAQGETDKNISAPGASVLSTSYSTNTDSGTYQTLSGTSMAAPFVSGVLALEFAANPSLTSSQAVSVLYETATDLGNPGWDATYGHGEANALAAVSAAKRYAATATHDISGCTVSPIETQSYAGVALTPEPTVSYQGITLIKGSDYTLSYARNAARGTANITITGTGAYTGSKTVTFEITATAVYRLYNPNSRYGEHLYTTSAAEYAHLGTVGWRQEGVAWYAPATSSVPVWRLYNPNSPEGTHHYTTSKVEYDNLVKVGWRGEGVAFYSDPLKGVAMCRVYNPNSPYGTHHYTASVAEYRQLGTVGWRLEGMGCWYGVAS